MDRSLSILIVEDDPSIHRSYRRLLKKHKVIVAESVASAADHLKAGQKFDALITDHQLPDGTGRDVVDGVLCFFPYLPVVVASSENLSRSDYPEAMVLKKGPEVIELLQRLNLQSKVEFEFLSLDLISALDFDISKRGNLYVELEGDEDEMVHPVERDCISLWSGPTLNREWVRAGMLIEKYEQSLSIHDEAEFFAYQRVRAQLERLQFRTGFQLGSEYGQTLQATKTAFDEQIESSRALAKVALKVREIFTVIMQFS